ncbi:winged helix-turn-helix domain-containing protein [Halosimplex halophilum]|uniref:winged helix-turn-helix domain-containing protein n=1 Tax=Halosimplex halophilum TaxID=2559572 RepID=UPI00107EF46F|nr:winged helix-turn-helix domain-containing protein [Halosimplex halophilum]
MSDDSRTLSPDEAFEVLGNETRVAILSALGGADEPVSFSALRDRVGMADSGRFNYHLDRLTGHFVRNREAGYELRRAGERVVEAVLSGAVTAAPVLERTEIDHPCHFCGAPVAVRFREERVEVFCTECPGTYSRTSSPDDSADAGKAAADGYLGYHPLPPAGVAGRDPAAVFRAAWTWGHLELFAAAAGVCPRCSAALDRRRRVCESHDADARDADARDADGGLCDACGRRYAVAVDLDCSNCIYEESGAAVVGLADSPALLAFLLDHGLNPLAPTDETLPALSAAYNDFEESVRSTDPFEARFTFAVDGDELALTVDDDLRVVDAERR